MPQIAEIKASSKRLEEIRSYLKDQEAIHKGTDHQVDTYFKIPNGRLKLRQGNVETNLIYYNRPNTAAPKKSKVLLYQPKQSEDLKAILEAVHEVLCVVDKQREIYFIDNVKFHLDTVKGLGTFVEIEAIDETNAMDYEILLKQCKDYMERLDISSEDLIAVSYSDLIMQQNQST